MASSSAGGMITRPSLRNVHAPTACPSRRSAVSHRMVASEPVTDRFGPRSMPTSTAPVTAEGACAACTAVPAISPAGRLFRTLHASASTIPAPQAVPCADRAAASCSRLASWSSSPVRPSASTSTNNPATSGSTPQEMPRSTPQGACRARQQHRRRSQCAGRAGRCAELPIHRGRRHQHGRRQHDADARHPPAGWQRGDLDIPR